MSPEQNAANVLGHTPDAVIFDGEEWQIICSCSWETRDEDDEDVWEDFNDHVFDDVNTILRRQRDKAKVVTL